MLRKRIIPILLIRDKSLVKTVNFNKFSYIGDPCNTLSIFNDLEVDEICILDILASSLNKEPNFGLLSDIADECFMPLCYGGGITSVENAKRIFDIGFEKVSLNSNCIEDLSLVSALAKLYGSQSIVCSVDVKKNYLGKDMIFNKNFKRIKVNPYDHVKALETAGAGEILLTSVNREGTWSGADIELIEKISDLVNIPVIAQGGIGSVDDISSVFKNTSASAVGVGSLVSFQGKDKGVLINFPEIDKKPFV